MSAGIFLRQHPPSSPLMMFYGEAFPEFLAGMQQLSHLGYLPDVARLMTEREPGTKVLAAEVMVPPGEEVAFKPGGFIQIEAPPHELKYKDFQIEPEYRGDWDRFDMWRYVSKVDEETTRAYSMASYPEEKDIIMLNVRIATPPPNAPPGTPTGVMSSWLFGLKPGDTCTVPGFESCNRSGW